MARNTQVAADHNAPPVTQILARFVASIRRADGADAVEKEAHRTLLNWIGCAVGAANHEAADAALAAVQMLQPAPQASVLGRARARRHCKRGADQRHHLAHLRLR